MKHQEISTKSKVLSAAGWLARLAVVLLALASGAFAQDESRRWTANVGGGFTPLVGSLNQRLDNGWHIAFGAGYRVNARFTIGGQVMYNGFGVSKGVLQELTVPDGNSHLWAFTAEPKLYFAPRHRIDPYFVGGVGYYRRVVQFTRPSVAAVTIFDPFFGFLPALIPADQVLGTIVRDGPGGSIGAGFSIPIRETGAKFYSEIRFHYADNGGIPTRMIPWTIGIRF
jgi:hypothetical protein